MHDDDLPPVPPGTSLDRFMAQLDAATPPADARCYLCGSADHPQRLAIHGWICVDAAGCITRKEEGAK